MRPAPCRVQTVPGLVLRGAQGRRGGPCAAPAASRGAGDGGPRTAVPPEPATPSFTCAFVPFVDPRAGPLRRGCSVARADRGPRPGRRCAPAVRVRRRGPVPVEPAR